MNTHTLPTNPYAPPSATLDEPQHAVAILREGRDLRVARTADLVVSLPDRCVRCNADASGLRADSMLTWTTPWMHHGAVVLYAAAFVLAGLPVPEVSIGLLGFAVLLTLAAIVTRKRVLVVHGVCERHRRFRTIMRGVFWALLALTLALCAGALMDWARIGLVAMGVLVALIIVGLIANGLRTWSLRVAKLAPNAVWLRGAAPVFRNSFPTPARENPPADKRKP